MQNFLKIFISIILLAVSLVVTYSTALASGLFLALGSAVNLPLLTMLGLIRGSKTTTRKNI